MRIGFAGPVTLSMLSDRLPGIADHKGYAFAGSAPLIRAYLDRGHEVDVVTSSTDVELPAQFSSPSLRVTIVPSRARARDRALDAFAYERRGVREALKSLAPDVIHAHWTYEFGLGSLESGLPTLVTVHDWGPAIALSNRHVYWYLRALMQIRCITKARHLSAPSEYIANKVRRFYGKDCSVVRNAIDNLEFGPVDSLSNLVAPRPAVGMLNVGFTSRKNVKSALRAWPLVTSDIPDAQLLLAGPGYEPGGPAHQWAEQNKLVANVNFLGPIEPNRVPAWLRSLDLFLHTSVEESFGLVLAEAMASGTAVVAGAKSGAVGEVVGDAGRLIDVRRPAAIAREIAALLKQPSILNDLRTAGPVRAAAFSLDSTVDGYLELLGRVRG